MKKYLIAGAMVSVLGGLFASCQQDEMTGSLIESRVETYKQVFKEEFGTIDSNQDWGFGVNTVNSVLTSRTRTISSIHSFASAPVASEYKSAVPDGVTYLGDLNDIYNSIYTGGAYWVDENVNYNMDFGRGVCSVYIVGTVTPSNLYLQAGSTLYLTSGSKLVLNNYSFGQNGVKIYVASGATLECSGQLQISTSLLYNAGTVNAGSLQAAGSGRIYNQGAIELSGDISVENNNSEIVNDGTITASRLHTAGTGHVQNNGDMTISGNTDIDSNFNTWVNNGHYSTQNFNYTAGSNDVINNCFLVVSDDFRIFLGDNDGTNGFQMDAGAGVVTTNFYGGSGPFYIYMGEGAVFNVTNEAYMDATKADYGIYGPSSGSYAVFQAKDIKTSNTRQGFDITYGGKLVVVAETHFDSETGFTSNDGNASHPIVAFANGCSSSNIFVGGNYPNIYIPASTCNPGFGTTDNPTDDSVIPIDDPSTETIKVATTTVVYSTTQLIEQGRVFCEDLGTRSSNDVDFNDAVFDAYIYEVKEYVKTSVRYDGVLSYENDALSNTSYYANIVLLAAGGTFPLSVAGKEIHAELGAEGTNVIVNTCSGDEDAYGNPYINTTSAVNLGNFPGISRIKDIEIVVKIGDEVHELTAEQGEAAEKICIEKIGTKWTKERKRIKEAYNFKAYVNDATKKFWEDITDESLLYNCSWDTYSNRSTDMVTETKSSTTVVTTQVGATTGGYDDGPVLIRRK